MICDSSTTLSASETNANRLSLYFVFQAGFLNIHFFPDMFPVEQASALAKAI